MDESEPTPTATAAADTARQSRRAQLGSAIAVVISLIALGINLYQTRLLQAQARATVWPYVLIGGSYQSSPTATTYAVFVDNDGVGPAIVKSVRVTLEGRPVRTWPELSG